MLAGGGDVPVSSRPELIRDAADPRIADYAHLGDPASLRAHGLFVAEGRLVVERLVAAGRFRVRSLLLTPAAADALADRLPVPRCPVYLAARPVVASLTGFSFHQGCLALAERGADLPVAALTAGRRLLAIEGVGNPDNVGGLFRVAGAFGLDGVLIDAATADPLYRKAVRTSMGAAVRVPFARTSAFVEALAALRTSLTIVALTPRSPAVPLRDYQRTRAVDAGMLLLVGAEGPGLSDEALRVADVRVSIPLAPDVDSLNVVVAAGIAMATLAPTSGSGRGASRAPF